MRANLTLGTKTSAQDKSSNNSEHALNFFVVVLFSEQKNMRKIVGLASSCGIGTEEI